MSGETKKFSWGPIASDPAVSLLDVMSEDLAKHLNHQDELSSSATINKEETMLQTGDVNIASDIDLDTSDDFLIAQMLQKQYDKEYDHVLHNVSSSSKVLQQRLFIGKG